MIPFNKPYLTGKELDYIQDAVNSLKLSGNGKYTQKCQSYLKERYQFGKCLLTSSCTDALEMAAILANIQAGDEVIMPSYTFVSTANAFVLRGAQIRFVDSRNDHPGMDELQVEALITPRTKAVVCVHYAGVACDMDILVDVCKRHNLFLIEDAAQAIDSFYKGKALGSFGHFAAFSFHETKNIISGEGGMLVVNDEQYYERAEIIWEKGTNRSAFFRGEVDKYGWVDVGSSFLPSEMTAAFLWAQLENLDSIQQKRTEIWNSYWNFFSNQTELQLPSVPDFATNNAHMFYLVLPSLASRNAYIQNLKQHDIHCVFHYLSLHTASFYAEKHDGRILNETDRYSDCLVRMPMFYELDSTTIHQITNIISAR